MKRLIRLELKKAFKNRYLWISLSIMTLFAVLSAVYMCQNNSLSFQEKLIESYYMENGKLTSNPLISLWSFYNSWVGGECMSLAYSVFYTLLPVGAALPYAWSFFIERKTGYIKNVAVRANKLQYFAAKTIAVFVSGTWIALIPMLLNVLITSAFLPVYQPEVNYVVYTHVNFGDLWADLYYTYPFLHLLLFALMTAFFCGLFALLSFAVTFYINNRVALLITPFLSFLALQYVETSIAGQTNAWLVETVPMNFLHATAPMLVTNGWVVLGEAVLFLAFSLLTIFVRGKHDEIY